MVVDIMSSSSLHRNPQIFSPTNYHYYYCYYYNYYYYYHYHYFSSVDITVGSTTLLTVGVNTLMLRSRLQLTSEDACWPQLTDVTAFEWIPDKSATGFQSFTVSTEILLPIVFREIYIYSDEYSIVGNDIVDRWIDLWYRYIGDGCWPDSLPPPPIAR